MIDCINHSRLETVVRTDPGLFINQLEVRICFLSSAKWAPTSCTLAFPLCILVLYVELIPSSLLNWISSPSQIISPRLYWNPLKPFEIKNKPPGGILEDLRYSSWQRSLHKQGYSLISIGSDAWRRNNGQRSFADTRLTNVLSRSRTG